MPGRDIGKTYDPAKAESKWYDVWEDRGYFHAEVRTDQKPYCIMIPPPNVTGILHMGHVLDNTIQDVYIRHARMSGFETLWLPGTDHAGIATQSVVEKELDKQQISKHDLGRDKFVEKVWEWREKYGGIILQQLRKLGCSCDWTRERFTLDPGLSRAVRKVFVHLYGKGLIYRGHRIVNWSPGLKTAISDDEVVRKEILGHLWYIRYPLAEEEGHITVATTRPETMLGDTAVAVNPSDQRYKHLVGKMVNLPLTDRQIPIIADDYPDPESGTGALKVTPAHDYDDFEIGQRHNLPAILIMDVAGHMNENAPLKYQGMDRFKCRQQVLEDLETKGLLEKVEDIPNHPVGHCYRSDVPIEPYLTDQWFLKMKPLADPAFDAVNSGRIHFYPVELINRYNAWFFTLKDWCISRQLWWGHRIPIWTCQNCGYEDAFEEDPDRCPKCESEDFHQEGDVLDTWFSSWLWPFSTLGWPEKTPELDYFYPTDLLITGPDIIFLWVARMIMAGLEFMQDIPFKAVSFHGIIRDIQGRMMSKTLGNSPDPLDVINEYGADALRFTVVSLTPRRGDIRYANELCEMGRNFANKVWNATRFLLLNAPDDKTPPLQPPSKDNLTPVDRWILSEYHRTVEALQTSIKEHRLNDSTKIVYSFLWDRFCDWYLESIKVRLSSDSPDRQVALDVALYVLEGAGKLLHPLMPYLTEEIWQALWKHPEDRSVMIEPFPKADNAWLDPKAEKDMEFLMKVISAIRGVRGEMHVPPQTKSNVVFSHVSAKEKEILLREQSMVERLASIGEIEYSDKKPKMSASAVAGTLEIYVPLEGLIDLDKEKSRISKEINRLQGLIKATSAKLNNPNFVQRAPEDVVERERTKLEEMSNSLEKLEHILTDLTT
ncbi:valine--tRNA ligase [bacterium SM23_57]|nr:MAG: valine--tRNA ligase [bacterium SM23_57]